MSTDAPLAPPTDAPAPPMGGAPSAADQPPAGEPTAQEPGAEESAPPDSAREPKYVPLSAVITERQARKEAEQRLQQLEDQQRQAAPLLQAIAGNPVLQQAILAHMHQGAPPHQEAQQLTELAQGLGLYTAEGQPDLQAAGRVQRFVSTTARREAEAIVGPVQQQTVTHQAAAVKAGLAQVAAQRGVSAERLQQVTSAIPDELLVQPQVANLVLAVAAGLGAMQGEALRPQLPDPLFTESPGGRHGGPTPLGADSAARLKAKGFTDQDLARVVSAYTPGAANRLE